VGYYDPGTRQEETAQRGYLSNFGVIGPRALIPVKYLSGRTPERWDDNIILMMLLILVTHCVLLTIGGQRMRVALACALFRRPDVLILDEYAC
jgi:hypothetical protein